ASTSYPSHRAAGRPPGPLPPTALTEKPWQRPHSVRRRLPRHNVSRDCGGRSWRLLSGSSAIECLAQVSGEIRSIVACSVNEGRFATAHERQTHDIHSRCGNDPAIVRDASLAIENGNVQPGVVGAISCRPNHRTDTGIDQVQAEPGFRFDICRLKAMRRGKLLRKPARVHPIIDA